MIIFLHGPDTYRSRAKLKELKEKFIRDVDPSGANLVVLDGSIMKADDFRNAVSAISMFVRKRMVVVERLVEKGKQDVQEAVASYIESGDMPEDVVIVFWEGGTGKSQIANRKSPKKKIAVESKKKVAQKTVKLLDVLKKQEYAQEFKELTPMEVERWITKEVAASGGTIEPVAVRLMAASVGGDVWRLSNEIGKLLGNKKTISVADVREHVISGAESAIFDFTDALSARNSRGALACLERERQAGSAPLYLLTMIVRQFRILLQLKTSEAAGVPQHALADALHLNPYVIRKSLPYLNSFSLEDLKDMYGQLLDMDICMKTSKVDPDALLALFVAKITKGT